MKAILIFLLLDLTLTSSYKREMAVKSVDKYYDNIKESESNKVTLPKNEESANFVSQCMFEAGQDFEGCSQRDKDGKFKSSYDLKECLKSKGWRKAKKGEKPIKGNPIFMKDGKTIVSSMIIGMDGFIKGHQINCCSVQPYQCKNISKVNLDFYTK